MQSPISAVVNHTSCCNLRLLIVTRLLVRLRGPEVSYMILVFRNIPPSVRDIVLKSEIPESFSASLQFVRRSCGAYLIGYTGRFCIGIVVRMSAWSPKR